MSQKNTIIQDGKYELVFFSFFSFFDPWLWFFDSSVFADDIRCCFDGRVVDWIW
jgi:hypothetical protein